MKFSSLVSWPVSVRTRWYIAAGFLATGNMYANIKDPRTGQFVIHEGEDWNLKTGGDSDLGQPVFAVADGVVLSSDSVPTKGWGQMIYIDHPQFGVQSGYAHLSKRIVNAGQTVKAGDQIGNLGKSGFQPQAHLHFHITKKRLPYSRFWSGSNKAKVLEFYINPSDWLAAHGARELGDA